LFSKSGRYQGFDALFSNVKCQSFKTMCVNGTGNGISSKLKE
jgi:hypothetical protein